MDERKQLAGRVHVAPIESGQDAGDLIHEGWLPSCGQGIVARIGDRFKRKPWGSASQMSRKGIVSLPQVDMITVGRYLSEERQPFHPVTGSSEVTTWTTPGPDPGEPDSGSR
jgi:hypothetical protein